MRVAVFLDGTALHDAATKHGFKVDFKRLREWYTVEPDDVVTFEYFATEVIKKEKSTIRKLLDYLETDGGYRVRSIVAEIDDCDSTMSRGVIQGVRSEVLVWMAVDMLTAAASRPDMIVLWSGEIGLAPVVEAVQRLGVAVTVVGERELCSSTLKRAGDTFVDIAAARQHIEQKAAA